MAHDYDIKHFGMRDAVLFKPHTWLGLFTIKLVNNKYETVIVRSSENATYSGLYIHFLNVHVNDEQAAIDFHNFSLKRLKEIAETFEDPNYYAAIDYIEKNIPELTRYHNSVPYEYPSDVIEHRD